MRDSITQRIITFVQSIGLELRLGAISDRVFVPGIVISHGTLVVDISQLTYPGDLLHEAGHLAVMTPSRRRACHMNVGNKAAEEMMAIAWSYAACVHLGLEASVVFHDGGYRGGGPSLAENFTQGRYIGVPMLQWIGLTAEGSYPHMLHWLRQEPVPSSIPGVPSGTAR